MVTVTSSGQIEKALAALAPRTKKRGKTEEKLHRNRKQEATQSGSVMSQGQQQRTKFLHASYRKHMHRRMSLR